MNAALHHTAATAVTRAGTRVHRDAHAPGTAVQILLAVDGGRSAASAVSRGHLGKTPSPFGRPSRGAAEWLPPPPAEKEAGSPHPRGGTECPRVREVGGAPSNPSWRGYSRGQTRGVPTLCNAHGYEKRTVRTLAIRTVKEPASRVPLSLEQRSPRWLRGCCCFFFGL